MLLSVLEIFVVWHPGDTVGQEAAEQIFEHFHGTIFSGLLGGAIEVYVRSNGWRCDQDAPRSIPFPSATPPNGLSTAHLVAVVPVLGNEFAAAVQAGSQEWWKFAQSIVASQHSAPDRVGVFPLLADDDAVHNTELGRMFNGYQRIAAPSSLADSEPLADITCRDLAQGIAQFAAGSGARLNVFISHTKRASLGEEDVLELIALVRTIISETRLRYFFDANDLQPGRDWDNELRTQASNSAFLALRTDLYATREWCQREMLIAKRHGMPIVVLDSLGIGEERGSFLMDHVPRIPVHQEAGIWSKSDIRRGLNVLVDECLKRTLWNLQKKMADLHDELEIDWWAPHAPEPITLIQWLEDMAMAGLSLKGTRALRILHPDPPLGRDEMNALQQIANLTGHRGPFDVMTPRMLAARGV